jgi:ATP-dependent Clp protease ATP-binding subunit ClpB
VLDDGRLTDGQGRTVDFKNTVIIMTSNIGSQVIQDLAGKEGSDWEIEAQVRNQLRDHFRPEFLNRVDEIVIFHTLGKEQLRHIVSIQLRHLEDRLKSRGMYLKLSDAAKTELGDRGFDPVFGVRPLKRVIQQEIENPLAAKILNGEFGEGDTITIDADAHSRFAFHKGPTEPVA